MAKRRGNNEGTLYQRKDGLWCAQISLNGRRLTKYAKQRSECYLWIRETLGRIHSGLSFDGIQMTLESYVETWLKGKELARRPKTVQQYAQLTRQHILPILGQMRLTAIQPAHKRFPMPNCLPSCFGLVLRVKTRFRWANVCCKHSVA